MTTPDLVLNVQAMAVKLVVRHPKSAAGQADEVSFEFEQARVAIGRSPGADVRLPGLTVSELHATIERQGSHYALRDEGSTNGTRINDTPLVPQRPRTLSTGDTIEIGEFTLSFSAGPLLRGPTLPERTASLARRMLRELSEAEHAARLPPFLRVTEGPDTGTSLNLGEPPARIVIGRGDEADLVLQDRDASRAHVEVVRDLDGAIARDLESKNGLEVNGKRLRERRLRHGDLLRIGKTAILYQDPAEQALKGLEGQADITLTRTRPVASPEKPGAEKSAEPVAQLAPPTQLPAPEASDRIDLLVYALAAFVLLASIVGLVWLFS